MSSATQPSIASIASSSTARSAVAGSPSRKCVNSMNSLSYPVPYCCSIAP